MLWGRDTQLAAGDRLAFVQGSFAQVVTLAETPHRLEAPGWVEDPADAFDPTTDPPARVTLLRWNEPLARALAPWATAPLTLHANLVDARFGMPRRAEAGAAPQRDEVTLSIDARTSIVTRQSGSDARLLSALRVPEWPVVEDDDGPAVTVTVSGETWTRVEHPARLALLRPSLHRRRGRGRRGLAALR